MFTLCWSVLPLLWCSPQVSLCGRCCAAVLAAALLLGAKSAVGTDTDPLAVRAAAANAALNGLEGRFQLLQCGANLSDPDPMLQVYEVPGGIA